MRFLKSLGDFAGEITGTVLGGSVRAVGELTGSQSIKDVGDDVEQASKFVGKTAGEAASGTWDVASGIITQDRNQFDEGVDDVSNAAENTVKGVEHSVRHVVDKVVGMKDKPK